MSTGTAVCIPDRLLRPSAGLPDTSNILRVCNRDLVCLPCQLHTLLGTNQLRLSRANKQLHDETAFIPCTVTTFSVHNLYYLRTFLQITGSPGRKALNSLLFVWKLPEEETHTLQMYTNEYETYTMLLECYGLKELDINVDISNLLPWRGNGNPRTAVLNYLHEIPSIELLYGLRGLRNVRISWTHVQGLEGMEDWVRWMVGLWRLPHGAGSGNAGAGNGLNCIATCNGSIIAICIGFPQSSLTSLRFPHMLGSKRRLTDRV